MDGRRLVTGGCPLGCPGKGETNFPQTIFTKSILSQTIFIEPIFTQSLFKQTILTNPIFTLLILTPSVFILFLKPSFTLYMFHAPRMTTVHEEKVGKGDQEGPNVEQPEEISSQQQAPTSSLPASRTCDSLQELAAPKLPSGGSGAPGNSPSLVSSGYGSQAASSTNLSR